MPANSWPGPGRTNVCRAAGACRATDANNIDPTPELVVFKFAFSEFSSTFPSVYDNTRSNTSIRIISDCV